MPTTKLIQDNIEKGVYFQHHSDGVYLFLEKNGCGVHPNRLLVCRLYPLCRYVCSEGRESFAVTELMPNCQGHINQDGTIATYLVSQDLVPYLQAADLYLGLFARLAETLSKEVFQEGLIPSRLHLYIFVGSSSYSSTYLNCTPASIPRRRLDLLLNATWYEFTA